MSTANQPPLHPPVRLPVRPRRVLLGVTGGIAAYKAAELVRLLREHGTERAGTCALNHEKRAGVFSCAGCDQPLFVAKTKFESGTGWPSFNDPLPGAVETTVDRSHFMVRTEVHCSRCGGHLGHVFEDGPRPTGLRYCMNGLAMNFTPDATGA